MPSSPFPPPRHSSFPPGPPQDEDVHGSFLPIVDLDSGGVIAVEATTGTPGGGPPGGLGTTVAAAHAAAREQARLPLVLTVPTGAVIGGSGAMAPLHEAMRATGRRPREVILVISGDFDARDRRALLVGMDGLRTIGYLVAVGGIGTAHLPLDLIADASPYAAVLSAELVERIARDVRRGAVGEAVAHLAKGLGIHVLAPGVRDEAQLAALRRWGIRLAQGPLLAPPDWRPSHGRVHVPLPVPAAEPASGVVDLGPRVLEFLLPAVTLGTDATAQDVVDALGGEPSITSVILVDEYQRPVGSVDRGRFLLSISGPYGHALHARRPARRLADPPRIVPKTTPAIAAMRVAGKDGIRVYDDLVVVDEVGRCMGVLHVSDLIRHVAATPPPR
ncbi:EAL domain-containing protein [Sphaerisporangium sp. TRM90804]|uniref:EAL domain-containing protein n=1 Tax=Sphaerisporangium sp. TRM90804 TaxID=3031113 RepID=UPI00244AE01A|nr:EAL domain-containing protein [Sphaerisporangium sp. TRM90804]MDH2430214.1 EAL domain-containing protein [Sphaerisporangium sp. TRM90804]